jgi:hypothetical protein
MWEQKSGAKYLAGLTAKKVGSLGDFFKISLDFWGEI